MRIGIDATHLTPESGGVRQYFGQWFSEILKTRGSHEHFVVFAGSNSAALDGVLPERWRDHARVTSSVDEMRHHLNSIDLLISTNPVPPSIATHVASVVTVPDVLEATFPRCFPLRERWARYRLHGESVAAASRILTLSEYSREAISSFYCVPATKIDVIPPAPRPGLALDVPLPDAVPATFVLYPANNWPHKNHEGLLRALAVARDEHSTRIPCVLTGAVSEGGYDVRGGIERYRLAGQVAHLGYLPSQSLATLLRRARAMVFASHFEGFGMPVLEAFQAGVPVACGNGGSLGEVAGEAALRFDTHDPRSIAAALVKIWSDAALQAALSQAGAERALHYRQLDVAAACRSTWDRAIGENRDQGRARTRRRRSTVVIRALRQTMSSIAARDTQR